MFLLSQVRYCKKQAAQLNALCSLIINSRMNRCILLYLQTTQSAIISHPGIIAVEICVCSIVKTIHLQLSPQLLMIQPDHSDVNCFLKQQTHA